MIQIVIFLCFICLFPACSRDIEKDIIKTVDDVGDIVEDVEKIVDDIKDKGKVDA